MAGQKPTRRAVTAVLGWFGRTFRNDALVEKQECLDAVVGQRYLPQARSWRAVGVPIGQIRGNQVALEGSKPLFRPPWLKTPAGVP